MIETVYQALIILVGAAAIGCLARGWQLRQRERWAAFRADTLEWQKKMQEGRELI